MNNVVPLNDKSTCDPNMRVFDTLGQINVRLKKLEELTNHALVNFRTSSKGEVREKRL